MPPIKYRPFCGLVRRKATWNVGSDDFTLPSLLAIVSRVAMLCLTLGTFVFPVDCSESSVRRIPTFFLATFAIFYVVLFLTLINEGVIFSISLRGRIHDHSETRWFFPYIVEIRIVLTIVETLALIALTVAVVNPDSDCEDFLSGPLVFAKVMVGIMWVLVVLLATALAFAVDPLGCCTPSLIETHVMSDHLGDEKDEEGFIIPGKIGSDEIDGRRRKIHVELGHRKLYRRFQALCCCISKGNNNSSSAVAMQDAAKALHTIFGDLDLVPSDVVAGLVLLRKDQRNKKDNCSCLVCTHNEEGSCESLYKDLRDLTFESMPSCQKPPDYSRLKQRPVDFDDPVERAVFEDVYYFMHYAMGIYGWALHVFQNPLTGLCSLGHLSCFRCNYRCCNKRAGNDIVNDDVCMCGMAALRVQSRSKEEDVVFATYQNDIYQTPFSVVVDHDRKVVVLALRGTLSIKDVLTDVSVTMVKVVIPGLDSDDLYIHQGMYRTAQWIKSQIHSEKGEKEVVAVSDNTSPSSDGIKFKYRGVLRSTMKHNPDYKLVVIGHSLGAGVASILSVLLRPAYPELHCYAYSPPGCIFSMPVAKYSEDFITTVVLGNDLIPRTSFRSLLHLKKQVEHLLKKCQKPKPQVLFQGKRMEQMFSKVIENPTVSLDDVKDYLIPDRRVLGLTEIAIAKKYAKKAKEKFQRKKSLHLYIKNINQGDHIASFPPGKILHVERARKPKPLFLSLCYPTPMKVTWKSYEDFSVISVDTGIVDDHLPTAVMAGLKAAKKQFIGRRYDPKETERLRMDVYEAFRQTVRRGDGPDRETFINHGKTFRGTGQTVRKYGTHEPARNGANCEQNDKSIAAVAESNRHSENGVHNGTQNGTSNGVHTKQTVVEVSVTIEGNDGGEEEQRPEPSDSQLLKGAATKASAFVQALAASATPTKSSHEVVSIEMKTDV